MNATEFRSALASMLQLDMDQLIMAGVIPYTGYIAWEYFKDNPWRWYINCDDDQRERLWHLIEARAKLPQEQATEV